MLPYPSELRERVHELYYEKNQPMSLVLKTLQKEFPKFSKRLTPDRLRSIASLMRRKHNVPSKHPKNASAARNRYNTPLTKQIMESARKLRQKNYRLRAIVDELKLQFPEASIPSPARLRRLLKGAKEEPKTLQVMLTGPSGTVVTISVNNKSVEKVIKAILEA
jgi:hypothetical protein